MVIIWQVTTDWNSNCATVILVASLAMWRVYYYTCGGAATMYVNSTDFVFFCMRFVDWIWNSSNIQHLYARSPNITWTYIIFLTRCMYTRPYLQSPVVLDTKQQCTAIAFFFVAPLDKKLPIVIRLFMAHRGQYRRVSCCQPYPLIFVNLGHWLQCLKIRVELGRPVSSCHKLVRSLNKSVQSFSKWNGNILILQLQLQVDF